VYVCLPCGLSLIGVALSCPPFMLRARTFLSSLICRHKVVWRGLYILKSPFLLEMGQNSSVGIATRYGLDGSGIESRWGEIFCTSPDRPWGPPILLYNGYLVFPGYKVAGVWRWLPTPSSDEVKQRVQLYLYSPSGLSWPIPGLTLPLPSYWRSQPKWGLLTSLLCCTIWHSTAGVNFKKRQEKERGRK
jgi:hypothetical protein